MSNYSNGANRERRIANKLRDEGWYVMRSAGSKSKIDLIALKLGRNGLMYRFIQSKATGYLNPKEKIEKKELEDKLGIVIEVI